MNHMPTERIRGGVLERRCYKCDKYKGIHFFPPRDWRSPDYRVCCECRRPIRKSQRARRLGRKRPGDNFDWGNFMITPPKEAA